MSPLSGNLRGLQETQNLRSETNFLSVVYVELASLVVHLVVVIEQSQSCCAALIFIDAHHGLGGGGQRVLQEVLPRLILAAEHPAGWHRQFVWYHHHEAFTEKMR